MMMTTMTMTTIPPRVISSSQYNRIFISVPSLGRKLSIAKSYAAAHFHRMHLRDIRVKNERPRARSVAAQVLRVNSFECIAQGCLSGGSRDTKAKKKKKRRNFVC